jgi:O-antigen/teichoic acid export membrane protein
MKQNNTKRYWLVSGLYAFFEKGATFLFGFGSLLILYRTFSEEEMGVWVLFLAVCSFLEVSRVGLIQNALIKFLSSEEASKHGAINTASLFLNLVLTLCFVLILILFSPFFGEMWSTDIIPLLHIYVLITVVLTPMFQSNFVLQANLSFRGIFLSNTFRQGLFFLFLLVVWLTGEAIELTHLVQVQLFTAFVGSSIAFYHARPFFQFEKRIDWDWVKKLLNFGKYAVSTNLSAILYKNMDLTLTLVLCNNLYTNS